ncbi:MAG: AraC family ligand binding domain-containing protein, partial [bacterium]
MAVLRRGATFRVDPAAVCQYYKYMTSANPLPGSNSRLDFKRYAGHLCRRAGIWTVRQSWVVKPHALSLFEINYVHTGEMTDVLSDGSRLSVHGGDVLILQPGVRHGCEHGSVGPVNYLIFGIPSHPCLPSPPFSNVEALAILRTLRASGNRVVRACRETDATFVALREALSLPPAERQTAWHAPWVRNLAQRMLLCIVRSLVAPERPPQFEAVGLARQLIERDLTESLSVARMAHEAGVS